MIIVETNRKCFLTPQFLMEIEEEHGVKICNANPFIGVPAYTDSKNKIIYFNNESNNREWLYYALFHEIGHCQQGRWSNGVAWNKLYKLAKRNRFFKFVFICGQLIVEYDAERRGRNLYYRTIKSKGIQLNRHVRAYGNLFVSYSFLSQYYGLTKTFKRRVR